MALEKTVKDIALAGGGLNLKFNVQLVPENQLVQADNVFYEEEGSLKKRLAVGNAKATTNAADVTNLFSTKEGTIGWSGSDTAGRDITVPATLGPAGGGVGIASLASTYGATASLGLGLGLPPDGLSVGPDPRNANNLLLAGDATSFPQLSYFTTGYGGVLWGVWSTTSSSWVVTPRLLLPAAFTGDNGLYLDGPYFMRPMVCQVYQTGQTYGQIALTVFGRTALTGSATYQQIAVVAVDTSGATPATAAYTAIPVTGTSQGPYASTFTNVGWLSCTSTAAYAGHSSVFAWSPMAGATNGKVFRLTGTGLTPTVSVIGSLPGTMGQTRPVTILNNGSLVYVADTSQYTTLTTSSYTIGSATNHNLGGGTTSIVSGYNGTNGLILACVVSNTVGYVTIPSGSGSARSTLTSIFAGGTSKGAFLSNIFNSTSGGAPHAWWLYTGTTLSTQNTAVCVNIFTGEIVGKAAYLAAQPNATYPVQNAASGMVVSSGGPLVNVTNLIAPTNNPRFAGAAQATILKYTWGSTDSVELPQGTMLAGLAPQYLTSTNSHELGFAYWPECRATDFSVSSTITGAVPANVQYRCCYKFVDVYGNVHYSSPSPAVLTSVGAGGFAVLAPAVGAHPGAGVSWFRTTSGGSTFYYVGDAPLTDGLGDSQISGNAVLYTTGGEVPNDPPPPATLVAATTTTVFAVSAENPSLIFFSKPFRPQRGVEFYAGNYLNVAPNTGPVTALGVMDDRLIIFKPNFIYVLVGSPPDVTGANGSYQLQQIASLSGCTNPASVINCDDGLFFQSAKGIELLKRDFTSEYTGLMLDSQVLNITAAVAVSSLAQVRFLDANQNVVWVYDLTAQRWSRFVYPSANFAGGLMASNNSLVYMAAPSTWASWLVVEVANTYGIVGDQSPPVVKTAWIKTAGMQGFGRLYRMALLGVLKNSATITVGISYDYNPTVIDTLTFTGSSILQFRSRVPRQTMEAIQFTITWPNTLITEDFSLTGISLEYGQKTGIYKLPAAQSV